MATSLAPMANDNRKAMGSETRMSGSRKDVSCMKTEGIAVALMMMMRMMWRMRCRNRWMWIAGADEVIRSASGLSSQG